MTCPHPETQPQKRSFATYTALVIKFGLTKLDLWINNNQYTFPLKLPPNLTIAHCLLSILGKMVR